MSHAASDSVPGLLPRGAALIPIDRFDDERGTLSMVYRDASSPLPIPVQWNVIVWKGAAMRGVHLHPRQDDYVVALAGSFFVGLCDLRPDASPEGRSALVKLDALAGALTIPRGVAHGLLSLGPATGLVGVNRTYAAAVDELGCRWDDPALGIRWPAPGPFMLSRRDTDVPSLAELQRAFAAISGTTG